MSQVSSQFWLPERQAALFHKIWRPFMWKGENHLSQKPIRCLSRIQINKACTYDLRLPKKNTHWFLESAHVPRQRYQASEFSNLSENSSDVGWTFWMGSREHPLPSFLLSISHHTIQKFVVGDLNAKVGSNNSWSVHGFGGCK